MAQLRAEERLFPVSGDVRLWSANNNEGGCQLLRGGNIISQLLQKVRPACSLHVRQPLRTCHVTSLTGRRLPFSNCTYFAIRYFQTHHIIFFPPSKNSFIFFFTNSIWAVGPKPFLPGVCTPNLKYQIVPEIYKFVELLKTSTDLQVNSNFFTIINRDFTYFFSFNIVNSSLYHPDAALCLHQGILGGHIKQFSRIFPLLWFCGDLEVTGVELNWTRFEIWCCQRQTRASPRWRSAVTYLWSRLPAPLGHRSWRGYFCY